MNDWMQRNFKTLALSMLWLLSLGGVALLVRRPAPTPIEIIPPPTATVTPLPTATPTPSPLRVYVSGAVSKPDVYVLTPGAIVKDAISAAGGFGANADRANINLAQPLYDGAQVHVASEVAQATSPPVGVSGPAATPTVAPTNLSNQPPAKATLAPGTKININTASLSERDRAALLGKNNGRRVRPLLVVENDRHENGHADAAGFGRENDINRLAFDQVRQRVPAVGAERIVNAVIEQGIHAQDRIVDHTSVLYHHAVDAIQNGHGLSGLLR